MKYTLYKINELKETRLVWNYKLVDKNTRKVGISTYKK